MNHRCGTVTSANYPGVDVDNNNRRQSWGCLMDDGYQNLHPSPTNKANKPPVSVTSKGD